MKTHQKIKLKRSKKILLDSKSSLKRLKYALKQFMIHYDYPDYMYTGDYKIHLDYCRDRMNGGRAKSILRLMKQTKTGEN